MGLRDEILEQPDVVARLVRDGPGAAARAAAAVASRRTTHVVVVARGTSDHAAIYAQYLFGVRLRLPVALAAPSVLSLYGAEPRFTDALVVGISQSGMSPDVVGILEAARRQGAPTVAITNEPASPLALAAECVIGLGAGTERAVAATKTYTAELVAVALLGAALEGTLERESAILAELPEAMRAALATEGAAGEAADAMAGMGACAVIGRGYDYATAREWALKLKELAQVVADPYSSADFRHGPLALASPGFPVLAVAPAGPAAADVGALLERLRADHDADLLVISDDAGLRGLGRRALALPAGLPPAYVPIVSIVPAQLFALHLTLARGLDPDRPRHISKVTLTT